MEGARLHDDGPAEAVPHEHGIAGANALQEGAARQHVEDALLEDIGLAVVEAEDADIARHEQPGQPGEEPARWPVQPTHRATGADGGAGAALHGMEHPWNLAAAGLQNDGQALG